MKAEGVKNKCVSAGLIGVLQQIYISHGYHTSHAHSHTHTHTHRIGCGGVCAMDPSSVEGQGTRPTLLAHDDSRATTGEG